MFSFRSASKQKPVIFDESHLGALHHSDALGVNEVGSHRYIHAVMNNEASARAMSAFINNIDGVESLARQSATQGNAWVVQLELDQAIRAGVLPEGVNDDNVHQYLPKRAPRSFNPQTPDADLPDRTVPFREWQLRAIRDSGAVTYTQTESGPMIQVYMQDEATAYAMADYMLEQKNQHMNVVPHSRGKGYIVQMEAQHAEHSSLLPHGTNMHNMADRLPVKTRVRFNPASYHPTRAEIIDTANAEVRDATRSQLIDVGAQAIERMRTKIESTDHPEALKAFDRSIGRPREFITGFSRDLDTAWLAHGMEYLADLERSNSGPDIVKFLEQGGSIGDQLVQDMNLNSHDFYNQVEQYSQSSGDLPRLSDRAQQYWKEHPRVHTAAIDVIPALHTFEIPDILHGPIPDDVSEAATQIGLKDVNLSSDSYLYSIRNSGAIAANMTESGRVVQIVVGSETDAEAIVQYLNSEHSVEAGQRVSTSQGNRWVVQMPIETAENLGIVDVGQDLPRTVGPEANVAPPSLSGVSSPNPQGGFASGESAGAIHPANNTRDSRHSGRQLL